MVQLTRWLASRTLAPFSIRKEMDGKDSLSRVSSVMCPSASRGTLKSARTRTTADRSCLALSSVRHSVGHPVACDIASIAWTFCIGLFIAQCPSFLPGVRDQLSNRLPGQTCEQKAAFPIKYVRTWHASVDTNVDNVVKSPATLARERRVFYKAFFRWGEAMLSLQLLVKDRQIGSRSASKSCASACPETQQDTGGKESPSWRAL